MGIQSASKEEQYFNLFTQMMSSALDDIVDLIDDAARAIIIFDVKEITEYARDRERARADGGAVERDRFDAATSTERDAAAGGDPSFGERRRRYLSRRDRRTISRPAGCADGTQVERDLQEA